MALTELQTYANRYLACMNQSFDIANTNKYKNDIILASLYTDNTEFVQAVNSLTKRLKLKGYDYDKVTAVNHRPRDLIRVIYNKLVPNFGYTPSPIYHQMHEFLKDNDRILQVGSGWGKCTVILNTTLFVEEENNDLNKVVTKPVDGLINPNNLPELLSALEFQIKDAVVRKEELEKEVTDLNNRLYDQSRTSWT